MEAKQKKILILASLAALVLLTMLAGAMMLRASGKPGFDADPVTLARFMNTPAFGQLPHDEQLAYMGLVSKAGPALNAAYKAGKLNEAQYANALVCGYVARKFKQVDGYMRLGSIKDRQKYLEKIVEKDLAKGKRGETQPATQSATEPDEHDDQPLAKIDYSEAAKARIANWPQDRIKNYEAFRKALKEHRAARGLQG